MKFRSTYLEADGTVTTSVLHAEHEDDLARLLDGAGRILIRARALTPGSERTARHLRDPVLLAFTKAMASLLGAGVPVLKAIDAIRSEEADERVAAVYASLMEKVEGGQSLADALASFPRIFNRLYVELVRAGEMTGGIDDSFAYIGRYLDWQRGIRGLIKQATVYPAILLCATYGLILAMLGFTIPRLTDMIANIAPDELPASTRVLMAMSDVVSNNMGLTLLFSFLSALGAWLYLRSRPGQAMLLGVLVNLPVASGVVMTINRARMCRTMAMLMSSGVTPIHALNMAAAIVALPRLSRGLRESANRLMEGDKMTEAFKRADLLPGLHIVMLKTGEESGQMAQAFQTVGDVYDEQAQEAVKRALAILEPLMTCVLAAIVVGVAGVVLNTLYGAMQGLSQ